MKSDRRGLYFPRSDYPKRMFLFLTLVEKRFIEVDLDIPRKEQPVVIQRRDFRNGDILDYPQVIIPEIKNGRRYLTVTVDSYPGEPWVVKVRLSRFIYTLVKGHIPRGMEIHHRDRNVCDNHPDNLEAVNKQEHVKINRDTGVHKHLKNQPMLRREDLVVKRVYALKESGLTLRPIVVKLREEEIMVSLSTVQRLVAGTYPFANES